MPSYYSFLPHLRQGLSGLLTYPDPLSGNGNFNERASVQLNVSLATTLAPGGTPNSGSMTVNRPVLLKGPGDITGINNSAILKVSPANWVTNMEPNYLPYIEFYDEDFPWRYTPAKAKDEGGNKKKLRPWISLVVLEESEFKEMPFNGIATTIKVGSTGVSAGSILPKAKDLWAWAHVHVNKDVYNGSATQPSLSTVQDALKENLATDPDIAVSRLLCPRKLKPNTSYHAFLIPTFKTGQLAGIGTDAAIIAGTQALAAAWGDSTPEVELPVYHKWFFKTGDAGDFESLVRLLQPSIPAEGTGKRLVDLQRSGNPQLEAVPAPRPTIDMEGVLKPLDIVSDSWDLTNDYADEMVTILNAPTIYANSGSTDPVIAPPIYGRWHAARTTVSNSISPTNESLKWINNANLDPRFRLFAGAGAEVVRKNQEQYMQIAWEQIGEVMEANRKIRQLQLSMQANIALHDKHIKKLETLSEELLLNMSAPLHTKIKVSSNTVYKDIKDSVLPIEMFTGAFRRLTRPNGPLLSSIDVTGTINTQTFIQDVNNNNVSVTTAYATPSQAVVNAIWASVYSSASITGMTQSSNYSTSVPGSSVPVLISGPNSASTQSFVDAVAVMNDFLLTLTPYTFTSGSSLAMTTTTTSIVTKTNPVDTIFDLAKKTVKIPGNSTNGTIPNLDSIVLATPKIRMPMYKELAAQSRDWMMPGLDSIQQNSINLLQSDQKYLEAYMLGLNHEMARELLWRGYPTDQRGTCFSFFWGYNNAKISTDDALAPYKDIKDIHLWKTPAGADLAYLGANTARNSSGDLLVLTIRGELLRKYPGALIYLQKAKWDTIGSALTDTKHRLENTDTNAGGQAPLYPIFSAYIDPDIYLLGFQANGLTPAKVKGGPVSGGNDNAGYFFVFQERAGELHFGADMDAPTTFSTWDDLSWDKLITSASPNYIDVAQTAPIPPVVPGSNPDGITWDNNSATVAYALLQSPVRLLVHGSGLIP